MKTKIVILGGGYAGVLSAKRLEKKIRKLKKQEEVEITLIDRNPFHTLLTELHEVAGMRVEEEAIRVDFEKIFASRNVSVVMDEIKKVDYETKTVLGKNNTYEYDYLVMATGSKPAFFNVTGAEEFSFKLWSYEDAIILKEQFLNSFRQGSLETDLEKQKQMLTFYIVGAGFTGVEMAGELGECVPSLCSKFDIDKSLVKIIVVDVLSRVTTTLSEKISRKVTKRLNKLNVDILLNTKVVSLGKDFVELEDSNNNLIKENTNTVIWTAGIEGSKILQSSNTLGIYKNSRIECDDYLRSKNNIEVYVAGDNIYYVPENETESVPQMVENCEASAKTITNNLIFDLFSVGEREVYKPKFHGTMTSLGGRYGVAYVGFNNKYFSLPSFLAMFVKHFINIIYFFQILGFTKVFSYLKNEIFTIRNRRSFLGGHFSNVSPSFFLVPLRIYFGFYWLYEGIKKVQEGWLSNPHLTGFFNGANGFYESILNPIVETVTKATGGVSGITAVTEKAVDIITTTTPDMMTTATGAGEIIPLGEKIISWDFFSLIKVILVKADELAFKLQIPLVDKFINKIVLSSDTSQMIFQTIIVVSEILIGVLLIVGLFTTISALYSLALQFMFLTSTGLHMSSWWMIFTAIALLFGGGKIFSLDYYVMPFLKSKWKNNKFVRKWYLYND